MQKFVRQYCQSSPFMIHFKVDEKRRIVAVLGVFHMSLDPQKWQSRQQ
jgi:hypothetical protein